jgi:eukaryotic-like serine/threonine-protein kinase
MERDEVSVMQSSGSKLTASDVRRLSRLLDDALDVEPDRRREWLNALTSENADLLPSLEQALFGGQGIETLDFVARMAGDVDDAISLSAGETVGPYRIIRELGSGGAASVWLAERADGLLQRKIALKLPHLGLIDRGLAERIALERNILAALEHPNIARLYDAGVDEKGRPYLAIEYVDGVSPDEYCARHALKVRQRLRLFLDVARAVAFAHTRLVVHRDLKPGNILVTEQGEVRLLDFGIARLLHGDSAYKQYQTRAGAQALTPAYAAPEQFTGGAITVATDVYSLGVILYELLTGCSPYSPRRRTLSAIEESVIHEEARLASKVADRHIARELRGDIDTILIRALRKNPVDRYASVESFAGDIERFLQAQPITARPPSFRYLAGKFARRNALSLSIAAVVASFTLGSLAVAWWQRNMADAQRGVAVERLAEAQAVTDFATIVLKDGISPDQSMTIDEFLARGETIAVETGRNDLRVRVAAADLVADWYRAYGKDAKANQLLTRTIDSLPQDARGLASPLICQRARIAIELGGRTEEIAAVLTAEIIRSKNDPIVQSRCLSDRAALACHLGDGAGAVKYALAAMDQYKLSGAESLLNQAELTWELGDAYAVAGQTDRAIEMSRRAMQMLERAGRGNSALMAGKRGNLGVSLMSAGDLRGGLTEQEAALAIKEHLSQAPAGVDRSTANLATTLEMLGKCAEADSLFERVFETMKGSNPFLAAYARAGQAQCAISSGSFDTAAARLTDARRYLRLANAPVSSAAVSRYKLGVAQLALAQGRLDDVRGALDGLLSDLKAAGSYQGVQSRVLSLRSEVMLRQGNLSDAWDDASNAHQIALQLQGRLPFSYFTGTALVSLGNVRLAQHRYKEAAEYFDRAVPHFVNTLGDSHASVLSARQMAARARSGGPG